MKKSLKVAIISLQEKIANLESQEAGFRKNNLKVMADLKNKEKSKFVLALYDLQMILDTWPEDSPHG